MQTCRHMFCCPSAIFLYQSALAETERNRCFLQCSFVVKNLHISSRIHYTDKGNVNSEKYLQRYLYCHIAECDVMFFSLFLAANFVAQQFSSSTSFSYLPPASDGTVTIPNSCVDFYINSITQQRYTSVSNLLDGLCDLLLQPDSVNLVFIPSGTTGQISTSQGGQNNLVSSYSSVLMI